MKTHNARIKAERMAARRERKKKAAAQKSRKVKNQPPDLTAGEFNRGE